MPTTPEVLYQSVIAFAVLFVLARVLGKRQIAQLTFFDYIAGITIGNIAASWSLDEVKSVHALLSLLVWTVLSMILAFVQRKSYVGRTLIDGRPIVLIENGNILEDNLRKAKLSAEELMLMLRQKNVFKLADAEYAVLENNGALTVMKKSESQPVTPRDLGLPVVGEHEPRLIVIDGHVMERSLNDAGYTREWLDGEIIKHGARRMEDVFLAQLDSNGNLYVDLYHDGNKLPQMKQKALIAATLKKVQADFETFSMQTNNPEAKQSYAAMAKQLEQVLSEVSPYLKE